MPKTRKLTLQEINYYREGKSAREVALLAGLGVTTVRIKLHEAGVMRSKTDSRLLIASKSNGNTYASALSRAWLSKPLS
jgi:hypothetical protein